MSPYRRNVLVGAVVLIGLGVLGWMVLKFANQAANFFLGGDGTRATLRAERADGVAEGSGVTYRGMTVGRVVKVYRRPDSPAHVYVDVLVDSQPPLPSNLKAYIRASSLLGASATISLEEDGQSNGQALVSGGPPLEAEYSGLEFSEVTGLFADIRQRKLIQHADEAITSIQAQAERAGKLLDSANELVADPKMRDDLHKAVANVREATEQANRIGASLEKFSGKLEKISADTSATVGEVRVTVAESRKNLDELSKQISGRVDQVAGALENLQAVTAKIDKGEGTAGALVNDPKLYQSLVDTSEELNLTVASLRRLIEQWEQEGVTLRLNR